MIYLADDRNVQTHWLPLTPEHGFPSLLFFLQDIGRSPSVLPMLHRVSFLASESVRKFLYYFAIKKGNLSFGSFPTLSRLFQASLRWHYPNQVMGRRLFLPLSLQDKLPFVFTCKFNYIPLFQKWQGFHSANLSKAACNIKCERTNTTSNDGYAFYRIYFFTIKSPKAQGGRENEARFF